MAELGFRAQIWTSCTNVLVGLEAPGLRDQLPTDLPSAPAATWPAASTVLVSCPGCLLERVVLGIRDHRSCSLLRVCWTPILYQASFETLGVHLGIQTKIWPLGNWFSSWGDGYCVGRSYRIQFRHIQIQTLTSPGWSSRGSSSLCAYSSGAAGAPSTTATPPGEGAATNAAPCAAHRWAPRLLSWCLCCLSRLPPPVLWLSYCP